MNPTIWKFRLYLTDVQEVDMPRGAQPLHVAMQHGALCLWCKVWPEAQRIRRKVFVHGTGHDMNLHATHYAGTALMGSDGQLVWHVFLEDEQ